MGLRSDGALLPTDNGDYGEIFGPLSLIFIYSLSHRVMMKTKHRHRLGKDSIVLDMYYSCLSFRIYCIEERKCGWCSRIIQS